MPKFHMPSDVRAKHVAHEIRELLASRGIPIKLSKAYEATARIYGFGTWNALRGSIGSAGIDPDDSMVDAVTAAARRVQHIQALIDAGVPRDDATRVIDQVKPTERGAVKATSVEQSFHRIDLVPSPKTDAEVLAGMLARCPTREVVSELSTLQFIKGYGILHEMCEFEETIAGPLTKMAGMGMTLADLAATSKAVAAAELAAAREGDAAGVDRKREFSSYRTGYGSMDAEWLRRMQGVLRRCPHASGRHFKPAEDCVRDLGVRWHYLGPCGFDLVGAVSTLEAAHAMGGRIEDLIHVLLIIGAPHGKFPVGEHAAGTVDDSYSSDCFTSKVADAFRGGRRRALGCSELHIEGGCFETPLGTWVREGWIGSSGVGAGLDGFQPSLAHATMVNVLHWFDGSEALFLGDVARFASVDSLVRVTSGTGGRHDAIHGLFLTSGAAHGAPRPNDKLVSALGSVSVRDYADYLSLPLSALRFERVPVGDARPDDAEPVGLNLGIARRMPWMYGFMAAMPEPALLDNEAVRLFVACYPKAGSTMHLGPYGADVAARAMVETDPAAARALADGFWTGSPVDVKWLPSGDGDDFRSAVADMEDSLGTGFRALVRSNFEAYQP